MAVEEQVPLIYAGVNGHLDSVPVNRIGQFEQGTHPSAFAQLKPEDIFLTNPNRFPCPSQE